MGMNSKGGGGSNTTYLKVYASELVLEYSSKEELIKKVETLKDGNPSKILERKKTMGKNEGETVYYYVIWDISGMITSIKVDETPWGDESLSVEITDVDEKWNITLGEVSGRIPKDFARRVSNLDLSKEVNIGLWTMIKDNGKSASGVKMYQGPELEDKVEYSLTYEVMPEPIKKTRRGKDEWDYSEQEDFIYDHLIKYISDNFKDVEVTEVSDKKEPRKPRGKSPKPSGAKELNKEEGDDLPF